MIRMTRAITAPSVAKAAAVAPTVLNAMDHKDGWKKVMREYFEFYKQMPDHRLDKVFAKIQSGEIESRVVVLNGEVIAATNFLPHAHTFSGSICYVNDLIVTPAARGNGVATRLFAEISDYARARGCGKVYWNTAPDNPARKLYDQVGYVTPWLKYEINLATLSKL